jgi:DNA repair photolyase
MSIKKSIGNMYEFITHTWNPVRGKCGYGCRYCYVGRWGEPKPLRLDEKELRTDLGHDNFIFVCSGCDLFHPDIPDVWIWSVINYAHAYTEGNRYLWHTKNPGRALDFQDLFVPGRDMLCATIESNREYSAITGAPPPRDRFDALRRWKKPLMITIEPVMEFDITDFDLLLIQTNPVQINIGADSGRNNLPEPSAEKLRLLIDHLKTYTRVHVKKNLKRLLEAA